MIFEYFNNISFVQPWMFWLFLLLPVMIFYYVKKGNSGRASIKVSTTGAYGLQTWRTTFVHLPFILRLLCVSAIIVALAKPQTQNQEQHAEGEGIDIVLCIDVSGSMNEADLTPNRLEAAKKVAIDFVNRRPTDRIAIVIFSGESFTQCPLTTDKNILVAAIQNIHIGLLEQGTAIGSGLATSVDRLRTTQAKSKVVLLLTDGQNNGGLIDPNTAKEIAKTYAVKVYTIGVAADGYNSQSENAFPGQEVKTAIDEKLLVQIASETGGKYFRARDNAGLESVYRSIDALEKTKVDLVKTVHFEDKFFPFVAAALFFLFLEIIFNYTIFRKFP